MKTNIPTRFLLILTLMCSAQVYYAQTEDDAFLQALELYPEAHEIWEQNGNRNTFDVDFVIVEPTCNGDSDGSICAEPVLPGTYSYFWFGSNSPLQCTTDVDAGNYLVQVTNDVTSESCIFNVNINEPSIIGVFAMNAVPPGCAEDCTGQANPLAGGGTGTLDFLYDSGENTQLATMLCNPFTLTITDDNGCSIDTTFIYVNAPDTLEITAIVMDVSCSGDMDGEIDATIEGGTGSIDYSWEFMGTEISTLEDIGMLDPGDYTLTVLDDNDCTADSTFTIQDAIPIVATATITNVNCNGDDSGAIDLDVVGGDSTYVFAWTGPGSFVSAQEDIADLTAGTYVLTITDGLNCDKDTSFIVEESLPIEITAAITEVDCFDAMTGAIDVSVNGPFPIDVYSWTGDIVSADEDLMDIPSGTYVLEVTDDLGCMEDSTFVLDNPDEILLSTIVIDVLCAGDSTGAIDLTAAGGTGTLSFEWSPNGEVTEDLMDIPAGDYTVTVTDENFCTAETTATIMEPLPIIVDETITHVLCNGESTGSIEVIISGGTGAYVTTWVPVVPTDVPAGTYTLTVQDENLCEETFVYEITEPTAIMVDVTVTDVICNGEDNGTIEVIATGGTGDLTITWTPAIDPDNVLAGDYLLTVTDENMCSLDTLITIDEPDEIILTVDVTDILCDGDGSGAIDLTATGGTGDFTYLWTPDGEMTQDLSGKPGGDYTVTVTDENFCTAEITATIIEPLPIIVDETITHVLCNGESTGSIEVIISGGTGAYVTTWVPVVPTDVTAGTYTLTVQDENLCEETFVYEILEPTAIMVDVTVTDVICNGEDNGTIEVIAAGGTGDLTITWTPAIDPDNVLAGDYLLTVTDENMCSLDTLITVDEPDEIFIDIAITHLACFGDDDGAIDITPTGGTGDYTYAWTGPAGTYDPLAQDISGLVAGTYTVLVTDENGCTETISGEVTQPLSISVDAIVTNIDCNGDDTGSIEITTSNGSGVFSYLWTGPSITAANENDEDIFDLLAGTYTLSIIDDNFCAVDTMFDVLEGDAIIVLETITDVLCFGDSTGSIVLDVTGGTGDLSYFWTNGMGITGVDSDLFDIPAGTYTLTVTDELACELTLVFTVDESNPIVISADVIDPLCFGDESGSIDITVTGDFPDFVHAWTGPPGFDPVTGIDLDVMDLDEGSYTVTVTDDVGCSVSETYVLTDPEDLIATLDLGNPECGVLNGMAVATVSGGTVVGDYVYGWFNADMTPLTSTGPVQDDLGPGAYIFMVSDDNGCSVTIPFELSDDVGSITALITDVICFDDCDGAIDVEIAGLTGDLIIEWIGPDGPFDTEDLDDVCAGDYTITVQDELGCEIVETYTVGSPDEIEIDATIINEPCPDSNSGAIDITATGGTGLLSYLWNGPGIVDLDTEDLIDLEPGAYTVLVTDESDCSHTESFVVEAAIEYSITATVSDVSCAGADDGAIDITVAPVLIGATFDWNGAGGPYDTEDISDLAPDTYTLQIITAEFCVIDTFFTVVQTDSILVVPTITNSICGLSTGAVDLDISGGTVAVDYTVEIYTIPDLILVGNTDLEGGTYGYTVSDDNGCEVMGTFAISDDVGTLTADIVGVSCEGAMNGAIDITVQGMTGDLTFQWTFNSADYSADEDISMLEPGFYTITITDENGCVLGDTYEVPNAVGIGITAVIDDIDCNNDGDGAIDISYTGVQGNPNFEWFLLGLPFSGSEDISDLDGGDYTILITDETGCEGTEEFTVDEPEELDVDETILPVLCNGENTGAISIDILGGTGAFDTHWSGPNTESDFEDISGLEAGIYLLELEDFNGCTFTQSYEVTQAEPISIDTIQLVNANCDLGDGIIEVLASGGNSPYDYDWFTSGGVNISSIPIVEDLVSGTYTVEIVDEDDCFISFDINISNTDATLTADITQPSCGVLNDGAIDLTVEGDLTPIVTYNWNGPGVVDVDTEDLTDLGAGDYTVLVEDGAGCIYLETFTLNPPEVILVTEVITDVTCNGFGDGAIDISHDQATEPTYLWNGPGVTNVDTQDLTDLNEGTYTLVVTTALGCVTTYSYDIFDPDPMASTAIITHVTCNGGSDGAIDLTLTGGTGDYNALWEAPGFVASGQDINGLEPGIYELSVFDDNLCVYNTTYEVLEPEEITVAILDEGPSSCNDPIGFIEVEGTGGNGGFTYIWTNSMGDTVSQIALADLLPADTYTVELTDMLGCTFYEDYIISNQDILLTAVVTDVSCFGLDDGAIDLTVIGNLTLVDTIWTGPGFNAGTEDISDLIAGDYMVELVDEFGCSFSDSYSVSEPELIEVTTDLEDLDCFGDEDGSISITTITGGIGDYSTEWTDEDNNPIPGDTEITGLTNGTYILIVTDDVPCAVEYEFEIDSPDEITVDENLVDPSCLGLDDGTITINVMGGQGGYDFEWTGAIISSAEDLEELGPGTYDLLITDDNLCTQTESFTLVAPQAIGLDLLIDSISCFGDDNGSIGATASGMNDGFLYEWTIDGGFFSDEADIMDLGPETYDLQITDGIGCLLDTSVTLEQPAEIIALLDDLSSVTCNGDADGAIDVTVSGGTGVLDYDWNGPDFTSDQEDVSGLSGGTYTLTLTDLNDCQLEIPYEILEPEVLMVTLVSSIDAECENTADGIIDILVEGGTTDYTYDWQGTGVSAESEDQIGLLPGQYLVTITDDNGCITNGTYAIDFMTEISVDAGSYDPVCNGNELTLMGSGAPSSSNFGWSTPGGPTFSSDAIVQVVPLSSNNVFIYTVTNGNCVASDTAFVDILSLPTPDAGEDEELFLNDMAFLGGDPTWLAASSFSWTPAAGLDDPNSSNPVWIVTGTETFTVTVIATNGCIGSDEVTITINPNVDVPSGFTPNGDSANETWDILNTAQFPDMEVQIFNRWGDLLWESQAGYPEQWDGLYEGKELPVGTYYFIIELNDERFPDPITGPITIFR